MQRLGTKVELTATRPPSLARLAGETGEIVETKKFIGLPYRVRLDNGGDAGWVGPQDFHVLKAR